MFDWDLLHLIENVLTLTPALTLTLTPTLTLTLFLTLKICLYRTRLQHGGIHEGMV